MSQQPRLIAGGDAGATHAPALEPGRQTRTLVWDIAVRVFHWWLVAGVAAAWLTGGTGSRLHELAGSVVAGLADLPDHLGICRHPPRALRRFRAVAVGAAALSQGHSPQSRRPPFGHNPAGGYMILLAAVPGCARRHRHHAVTSQFFGVVWVEPLHPYAANALMALVPIHLLGVVVSSWMHQENLVGAMLTRHQACRDRLRRRRPPISRPTNSRCWCACRPIRASRC